MVSRRGYSYKAVLAAGRRAGPATAWLCGPAAGACPQVVASGKDDEIELEHEPEGMSPIGHNAANQT
eukprot:COSAG01_NODE_21743_length_887_cov_1.243655_1_plen_67_part_00